MANNRLYVGSSKSRTYLLISKGFGNGWHGISDNQTKLFDRFLLETEELIPESEVLGKTSLVFFTESDELYDLVFSKQSKWREFV